MSDPGAVRSADSGRETGSTGDTGATENWIPPEVETVLITPGRISERVRELAAEITNDYRGRDLHLVGVLRGAAIFLADLVREIRIPVSLDYIAISSYGEETCSSGVVRIVKDLEDSIEGRHVLVVEDIIDTGLTLNYLTDLLRDRRPAGVAVCALLDKPTARLVEAQARYVGFTVPDAYVVGYGLDHRQRFRGLPYVATLRTP